MSDPSGKQGAGASAGSSGGTQLVHLSNYEQPARLAFAAAQARADKLGHRHVTRRHLLAVLLEQGHGFRALRSAGIDPVALEAEVSAELAALPSGATEPAYVGPDLLALMTRLETDERRRATPGIITVEYLFRALADAAEIPDQVIEHWVEEEPAPPQRTFLSADGGIAMGRSLLRRMTQELRATLDHHTTPEERYALQTIDTVEGALTRPDAAPGLFVAPHRLRARRARLTGEVTLTWSAAAGALVMTRGDGLTRMDRFSWSPPRNCWALGEDADGEELFDSLRAAILEQLYPEADLT